MSALSATQSICARPRQTARCAGSSQGQTDARTRQRTADGFLNHVFLPLYEPGRNAPPAHEIEMGYYSSLSILSRLYVLEVAQYREKPYPFNILLSYRDVKRRLNRKPIETTLHILKDDKERVKVATRQEFEPGHTLYFIPVLPLYRLLRKQEQRKCAELLLSVYAYLYHHAQIPYYRDPSSYMFYQYECNKEWLMECSVDFEGDEYEENMSDVWRNDYVGDVIERKIYNRYHLEHFSERLAGFEPNGPFQREALRIAADAWQLMQDYPDATVFRNVPESDPEQEDEVACFDRYVSFVGDVDGWLYDTVERAISDELNEYSETQVPRKVQVFDDPEAGIVTGLDFEYRLFELICNITTLLTN